MELLTAYHAVNAILETLDFNEIFEGFRKYRFALYNSTSVCFDGALMPYEETFMGNTSISYKNEHIAIWNMEMDPIEDMERLAYCMVHEMFHCYQKDMGESRYPSDLMLLCYPDDVDHFQNKYNENVCLARAYETQDIEVFRAFHAMRNARLRMYPDMVLQELRAEAVEGLAEYVGLLALQRIRAEKFHAVVEGYLAKLRAEDDLLFDARRIAYYSGTLYFLCMALFADAPSCMFHGAQTPYERNAELFDGADAPRTFPRDTISRKYAELQKKKEDTVSSHTAKSTFVACDAAICGYDPMNMFRVGNHVYCSHFVCLRINGKVEMLRSAVTLQMKEDSIKEIVGYYV